MKQVFLGLCAMSFLMVGCNLEDHKKSQGTQSSEKSQEQDQDEGEKNPPSHK